MKIIGYAVPFFILALVLELIVDLYRKTGYFRVNDTINSLSAGVLSTTTGLFSRVIPFGVYGLVATFAPLKMDSEWFNLTPLGLGAWALAIIAYDFCYYWSHRMGHEVNFFWGAHAVHHQSEEYNLSTALRQTSTGFLYSWAFYLPLIFMGLPLEVYIVSASVNLVYQFWVHTQHIGKLGILDKIISTPSNHRVHHGQNDIYLDKNYGGIFIFWDILFGTYQEELEDVPVIYGVRKPLNSWNPLWANLQVWRALWRDNLAANSFLNGLRIWYKSPGWRPAGAEKIPLGLTDLEHIQKYDPTLSRLTRGYTAFQFFFCALPVGPLLLLGKSLSSLSVLAICAFVWGTMFALGALLDNKPWARFLEAGRLSGVMLLAMFIHFQILPLEYGDGTLAPNLLLAYVLVSGLWFGLLPGSLALAREFKASISR